MIFERADAAIGGYDHVLYALGNSEYHANALAALRRRRGPVLAQEVRLSGLLGFSRYTRGAVPGGVQGAISRNYPGLPGGLGSGGAVEPVDAERSGLLMLKDIAGDTDQVLVCSEAGRRLALVDVGPAHADWIGVVPLAVIRRIDVGTPQVMMADTVAPNGSDTADARSERLPLVASFGIVVPSKRPESVI